MAEDKKPKIDLKARLGKAGGGAAPAPGAGGIPVPAVPAPVPAPSAAAAPAPSSTPAPTGLTPPPGVPVGPPPAFKAPAGLDPSNPLAAAVAPPVAARPAAPVAPPQPQRIEVDEMAVQEARKGARKQGLIAGLIAAAVLGIIGFIAGGASEASKGRARSVADAKSLATEVQQAREQLKTLADKVEEGRNSLIREKKFPDQLAKDINGIVIAFDGTKLAGVRFSGYPQETSSGLIEFVTAVQGLNDRKSAVAGLLTRLQKPISEQLAAGGKTNIGYVVLLGKKDPSQNHFALLAPLTKPIEISNPAQIQLPAEFTAVDPTTRANVTAPKYTPGSIDKANAAAGIYVLPRSMEAACPSETAGQIGQLGSQLNRIISDVRGEKAAPGGDVIVEDKPGLLDRADKLIVGLNKVQ